MKEATGGTLLMGLAAGIIIIFIIMVAFFISYSKAFKVKNQLINRIEQMEGMKKDEISSYIVSEQTNYVGNKITACYNKVERNGTPIGFTVKVVVYMQFERAILGENLNIDIPVSGETRIIEKGNYINRLGDLNLSQCSSGYTNIFNN